MKKSAQYSNLIGKYLNRYLYSDILPIGKIIGAKGKTTVIVRRVEASENKTKMNFITGGFSAICTNATEQEYDFFETNEVFLMRISKSLMKHVKIQDEPVKFHDFNF